jgi:hypothetical protein
MVMDWRICCDNAWDMSLVIIIQPRETFVSLLEQTVLEPCSTRKKACRMKVANKDV